MVIILLLWLFQTVFLDDFYKAIKLQQIKDTANDVIDNVENKKLDTYLDTLANESDYCIQIYARKEVMDNNGGSVEYYVEPYQAQIANRGVCGLQVFNTNEEENAEFRRLYQKAVDNDGEFIEDVSSLRYDMNLPNNSSFEGIKLGKLIETESGNKYLVIVSSRVSPVNETVETLLYQLMIITIILLVLALVIALLIANNISRPIRKVNEKAKLLGKGRLDVHFDGKGYVEIDELNDTLNYAVNELNKVESLRNELIANMSHDLRTPLTMISGYSEAIRDLPGEDTKENIQVIIDESKRLTVLVNSILDLSKIQAKVEQLNQVEYNLSEQLRVICDRFDTMLKNEHYEIIFSKNVETDVYVIADEDKIEQVLYNIIGNAIHYTGKDKKVYVREIVRDHIVRIEVEDTGKGIKAEDIPYVWDRYYKQKTNHKRQAFGTGLGLSIVRGIFELHKIGYGVISEEGKGAIFYFEISKIK